MSLAFIVGQMLKYTQLSANVIAAIALIGGYVATKVIYRFYGWKKII
ncbi:hypothetical protein [Ligilactobacillus ceti]|nr:hypothetical protein [Ligilactobacillus ceti]